MQRVKQHYGSARCYIGARINWNGIQYVIRDYVVTDEGYIYSVCRRNGTAKYTIRHEGSYMYAPRRFNVTSN